MSGSAERPAAFARLAPTALSRLTPPAVKLPPHADARLSRFDRRVDAWFESHLRNRPLTDGLFYAASALGDHGVVWVLLAGSRAARCQRGGAPADEWGRWLLHVVAALGVESAIVNGPVKWVFRRSRPIHEGPRPLHLRQPRTSSFPSGHASAAFFAAALLREGDEWWPLYYLVGAVVAASRVHVRIHHASDVLGGAIVGALLGELARRFLGEVRRRP